MKLRVLAVASLFALPAACVLNVHEFVGKRCTTAVDCPPGLSCAYARLDAGTTCEYLHPPAEYIQEDAGYASWCDVKPILDKSCNQCHVPPQRFLAPPSFRLDVYSSAKTKAEAIDREVRDTLSPMPPKNNQAAAPDTTPGEKA